MGHKVFIRHTYIYKCSNKKCGEEWKINEAVNIDKLRFQKEDKTFCFLQP